MSDSDQRVLVVGLGVVGAGLVSACVPKVSATLVVDETRPAERETVQAPEPSPTRDRTPPKVVSVELLGSNRLRIQFSEPVTLPANFDPADFRLSLLRLTRDRYGGSTYAYYYDPGYFHYGAPIIHTRAEAGEATLDIEFGSSLSMAICREHEYGSAPAYYDNSESSEALFLHYAASEIPITDTSGKALANFGAEWVELGRAQPPLTRESVTDDGTGRVGEGLVQLSCGPPIPPGPR